MKICIKCLITKELNQFYKRKDIIHGPGFRNDCITCVKLQRKQYCKLNLDKVVKAQKEYYKQNKDKVKARVKKYTQNNFDKKQEYNKIWQKTNLNKVNAYNKAYVKNRKQIDPLFKLSLNIRTLIFNSFKRGNRNFKKQTTAESILGCSVLELHKYLESKFQPGMTWENHTSTGWHIDHIIPLASAKTEEDVIKLNHYTNLQPLWAQDNMKKGNRY